MIEEYTKKNKPKTLYGFNSKSTNELLEILKRGKISSDSEHVILYLLKYERDFNENKINEITNKLIINSENQIFEDFGTIVNEKDNSLNIKFKKQNKYLIISLIIFLSISYLFIILPYSIKNFNDQMYLFGMLIIFIPSIILKMILRTKDEKSFNLEANQNFIKLKCSSTNYNELKIHKSNINNIEILEKDFVMKVFINKNDGLPIEIMSEDYNRLDRKNVYEYLNLIKVRLERNLNGEITYS